MNIYRMTVMWMLFIGLLKLARWGFPGGAGVENLPANAGDMGLNPCPEGSHMPQSN